jgi:hypothetical protein
MADFGAPIQQANPMQGLSTLQAILGIKQQQQALAGQQAQVQQEQQTAAQRSGIAGIDWSKYDDGGGVISTDKMISDPELRARAGDQFLQVLQQGAGARAQQLQNKQLFAGLNSQLREQFGTALGALRTDPDVINDTPAGRAKVDAAIAQFGAAGGPDAQRIAQVYAPVTQAAPPKKLERAIQAIQLQAMTAVPQAGAEAPTYAGAGNRLVQTNPLAAGGAPTGDITTGIAPGRAPFTDEFGRVFTFNPQTGSYTPAKGDAPAGGANQPPAGGGGFKYAPPSSSANGPGAAVPGEVQGISDQTKANFRNVDATRTAASAAPQQLDQIDKALALSQSVSTGGDWTARRANIESNLSSIIPGLATAQNDAAKVQELDKFLERVTTGSMAILGGNPSTDAERESIHRQNASTGYTPQAIQRVLQYAKAQTLAVQAKGDAQNLWLQQQGNGIPNQHNFETQWRQAYDPVLFQLEAAPNAAEQQKIIKSLPPAEAASLGAKRRALAALGVQLQ